MPVKITSAQTALYPLTSPPSKPIPEPPADLIAKVMDYEDRQILVSIPFPDTVELISNVLNELLLHPDVSGKSVKVIYQELDQEFGEALLEASMDLPDHVTGGTNKLKTKAVFWIAYDVEQPLNRARLTIWRTEGHDYGNWKVRFEFSPSKAGSAGFVKLTSGLAAALPGISVNKLIANFRVSRLDAAIDCIGAYPIDLIAHIPKPGKRMVYVGDNGKAESVYFYEMKSLPTKPPKNLSLKTIGPHRLTLYERRSYQRQLFIKPTYGDCPVTRAEVSIRWRKSKQRPTLAELPGIANLFKGRHVAYAAAVGSGNRQAWRKFCLAAFGGGVDAALYSFLPGPGGKFAKAYRACVGDLVNQTCWSGWKDGLAYTGLLEWAKGHADDL